MFILFHLDVCEYKTNELVYFLCLLFQISSLIENVQRLQSSLNQMRESSATRIRLLEEKLEQQQDLISRLEARLDSQRDYEELKREMLLMKGSPLVNDPSINGVDSKDTKDKRPSKISLYQTHKILTSLTTSYTTTNQTQ